MRCMPAIPEECPFFSYEGEDEEFGKMKSNVGEELAKRHKIEKLEMTGKMVRLNI